MKPWNGCVKNRDSRWRALRWIIAGGAIAVVAFLALRSSPWIGEVPWIPDWLAGWADRNGNFRNFPAFAGLTLILIVPLGLRGASWVAGVSAVGLESAQFFIAGRTFDFADIGWSLAGVALVAAGAVLVAAKRSQMRSKVSSSQ